MDGGPNFDRRIGERRDIAPVDVVVRLPGLTKGFRRKPLEVAARIVDVSVSGAGIVGPAVANLRRGSVIIVMLNGGESSMRISRVVPTGVPEVVHYGVQFVELDARLKAEVFAVLGRGRPPENSWLRSV